jgi:alkylation response protein AidB-like acyl-CoA dehydrogenase
MVANCKVTQTDMNSVAGQLIQKAVEFQPLLKQQINQIESCRQLPQPLALDLAKAGFYKICTPIGLGGLGASPETFCQVTEILAEASGSAAWCVFIGATSQYMLPALDPLMCAEITADPDVITSGVFAYSGTATPGLKDGNSGFYVDGRWDWGSGSLNASWISGGVLITDQNGERTRDREGNFVEARAFFQPSEIKFLDNWHVSGLRGSGSTSYTAENVFLPSKRVALVEDLSLSEFASEHIYRYPRFGFLAIPIGAVCLGMARASIDELIKVAKEKTPQGSSRTMAHRSSLHKDVALADTNLRASRALFYTTIRDTWAEVATRKSSLESRRALRTATFHAVATAKDVTERMYTIAGGTSIFEDSPLQRNFRDVHVAAQHMMVGEPVMELAGRVMLGLDEIALGL